MTTSRKHVSRGVILGVTLHRLIEKRIGPDGHRSAEVVRLISLALDAPRQPPLDADRGYLDGVGKPGRATIWASAELWARIDARSKRYGESASESIRALIYGGMAIEHGLEIRT